MKIRMFRTMHIAFRRSSLALSILVVSGWSVPLMAESAKTEPPGPPKLQSLVVDGDGWTLSGSARVRFEAVHNDFRPAVAQNEQIVLLRTSFFAQYESGPLRVGGELIDARAYGADSDGAVGTAEVNALELVQAYAGLEIGDALGSGSATTLRAGRFTIDLGSRRLVARNNFRNTTNSFTGIELVKSTAAGKVLTLFWTMPQRRLPDGRADILDNRISWDHESPDLQLWGAHYRDTALLGGITGEIYAFGLDERDSAGRATLNRHLVTPGLRLFRSSAIGKADFDLEAAYQFGTIRPDLAGNTPRQNVAAWFGHAELGYRFAVAASPRVAVLADLGSGDRPTGKYGRFDSLFGARRADFGPTSIFGPLGRSNIRSIGLRIDARPSKSWDVLAGYRANWLDSRSDSFASTGVRDTTGRSGRFGAHLVEARVRAWIVRDVLQWEAGGAALIGGSFLRNAPNSNGYGDSLYGYSSLTATF